MFEELMVKVWNYIDKMKKATNTLDFDPNDEYFARNCFLKETLQRLRIILENVENLNEVLLKAIEDLEKEVERRVNNVKNT